MCWREQRKEDKIKQQTLKKRQFNRDSPKWQRKKKTIHAKDKIS